MTNHHQPKQQAENICHDFGQAAISEDEFVSTNDLMPFKKDVAQRAMTGVLGELASLFQQKQWEDALSLFYPPEEKLAEVIAYELDVKIREKLAFALGQTGRFDEAIEQLALCIGKQPDNFFFHNALAYVAYNSLYAAKNKQYFLRGRHRTQRIELAHHHFAKAQQLRPDGVTNFYREGMLYRQVENKDKKALPLFLKAVKNWEQLDREEKAARHQERKNYVKALYNGAAAALACRNTNQAHHLIERCMAADENSGYIAASNRFFALGKVLFYLNRFDEAQTALETALLHAGSKPLDFAVELLARIHLCRNHWETALETIRKIPEKRRRPYICWTEADALTASGDLAAAARVLENSSRRDGRSRHKSLIRLARIAYLQGAYKAAWASAKLAQGFFEENWGRSFDEGLFWCALGALKCGHIQDAEKAAQALKDQNPDYPKLDKLLEALEK